jgi:hypothetical protein
MNVTRSQSLTKKQQPTNEFYDILALINRIVAYCHVG